jgi:hypothetical protein
MNKIYSFLNNVIAASPRRSHRLWGKPSPLSNEYRGALSLGVKQQGRKADHSLLTSAFMT